MLNDDDAKEGLGKITGDPRSPEAWGIDLSKKGEGDEEDWDDDEELELLEDFSAFDFEEGDEISII